MSGNNTGKSFLDYQKRQEFKYSYQESHPEVKILADSVRQKRGNKGLKQLSIEFGCFSPSEVDRFLKGTKLEPHQLNAIKHWLAEDNSNDKQ